LTKFFVYSTVYSSGVFSGAINNQGGGEDMYSYKIGVRKGLVCLVELWEESSRRPFRKIMVEAVSYGRFYTSTNFTGRKPLAIEGLTVSKSISKAVEGFDPDFVNKCIRAFSLVKPTKEDIEVIFPGAHINFDHH